MFKSREKFIRTSEDWFPNYNQNRVRVFCRRISPAGQPEVYRVAVWGADDTGMNKDFRTSDPSEAIKLYDELSNENAVLKENLKHSGFSYF